MINRIDGLLNKYEVILKEHIYLRNQLYHIRNILIRERAPSLEKDLYYTKIINKAEDMLQRRQEN